MAERDHSSLPAADEAGGRFDCGRLSASGSGHIHLAGRSDDLAVAIDGSGSVDAVELQAKRAKVAISGSGDVTVNASNELDATNNGSECALRACAVYRKITNDFRSERGAVLYAEIRSVVETARRRSIQAIDAIRLTLEGQPISCAA